ncbi:MAG: nucleotidyltransferase domain-containing protein [Defluviitaleaceae bacterium]|nr:nucleotidyltransferase domain-containing protein [Defluviitaleaceae bacterium]
MDNTLKQKLADKNQKLIDMVIKRAKRDFPDDIALIGLTGSFSTGDYHEKSDLDLIIVNNTDRGWEISACFIFDDVGYDIYCTPWETRLAQQAILDNPGVSSLTELQILYCAKPEYLERFNKLKQQALDIMAMPIGKDCINRAKKHIDLAKQNYTDMMLSDDKGIVRYASSNLLYNLVNGIVNLNNTCIKRGIKRYLEELSAYKYLPENFEYLYMSVIDAKTLDEIKKASRSFLTGVIKLHDEMYQKYVKHPVPTYENLEGTYEEAWSNVRNKVLTSVAAKDKAYAFLAANGAQGYFEEMADEHCGTKKFDLMQHFDSDNLEKFQDAFLQAMDEYLQEYEKVGRSVERYETFEALYEAFMS